MSSEVVVDYDPSDDLTENMEIYAYQRAMGKSRMEAIQHTSISSKTGSAAQVQATRWEKLEKVQRRIKEYREDLRESATLDTSQLVNMYMNICKEGMVQGDLKAAISALDRVAAMTGFALKSDSRGVDVNTFTQKENLNDLKLSNNSKGELSRIKDIIAKQKPDSLS